MPSCGGVVMGFALLSRSYNAARADPDYRVTIPAHCVASAAGDSIASNGEGPQGDRGA
jgi:hypothetical protein